MKYRLINIAAWLLGFGLVLTAVIRHNLSSGPYEDTIYITHGSIESKSTQSANSFSLINDTMEDSLSGFADFDPSDNEDNSGRMPEAVAANDSAAVLMTIGDFEEAIRLLNQAVENDSTYARAYYNLGLAYFKVGKINAAIREYVRSAKLRPHYYPPLYNLGVLYLMVGQPEQSRDWLIRATEVKKSGDVASAYYNLGLAYKRLNDDKGSMASYREALRLKPGYTEARYNLALLLLNDGKYDLAAAEFEKTAGLGLIKSKLYNNLGVCYSRSENYEKAIEAYRRAGEMEPGNASVWFNMAISLNNVGRPEEAIEAYKRALTADSTSPETHFNLALLYNDLKNYDEAIRHYQRAISLDSNYSKALYNLAHLYSDISRDDSAATYYEQVVALDPENTRAIYNLALAYTRLDDMENAAANYQRLIDIDPVNEKAVNNLGVIYNNLREYDSAYVYFNRLVRLNNSPEAYFNRAKAEQRLGKTGDARADYRKAIELRPQYSAAYNNLAIIEEKDGNIPEAVKILRAGIETGLAGWKSHWKLGQLYRDMGNLSQALEQFDLARSLDPQSERFNKEYEELHADKIHLSNGR